MLPGTVVAVCGWLAAAFAFKLYIQTFSASTTMYGSLGAVVVALLLWLFLSACCSSGRAERDDSLGGLEAGAPEARRSLEPRD